MDQGELIAKPVVRKKIAIGFRLRGGFFLISIIAALLSFGAWGWFYYQSDTLFKKNRALRADFSSLQSGIDKDLVNNLMAISNVLTSGRTLIDNHTLLSNAFEFLEKNTYPKVAYESINLSAQNNKIDLGAVAASYAMVAQQIREFESSNFMTKVTFGGLAMDPASGNIKFSLSLEFKPNLIRVNVK